MAKRGRQEQSATAWQWGLFALWFCLYALTSSPAIGWLDSPEFVASAASLGVAHSPGHPLPALLGRFASFIPIGDIVWRINLMSALCAAVAVSMLFRCGILLLHVQTPAIPQGARRALVAVFVSLAAMSWALWSNAVRAEVYALQAAITLGAFWGLLRYWESSRGKHLLLVCFCSGLGLANHHLLALLFIVPGAILVFVHRCPTRSSALWAAGMGGLGLCALAYLPLRSLAHPEVNFGAPHTLERFLWTLRGAAFSKSAHVQHASPPALDAMQIAVAFADALSVPVLILAVLGGYLGVRKSSVRKPTGFLFGVVLLSVLARVLLGFDPDIPDHHAYLLPAIFALFLLAILGIAELCQLALHAKRPLPKAPWLSALILGLLVPIQLGANWQRSNQAHSWASDDLAHWELANLPPRTLLLTAYFQSTFRIWALHIVEGTRPDLDVLDRSFLTYPGMSEEAKLRAPELAGLIDAPLRAGMPSPIERLRKLAQMRPVLVQLHPNVDTELLGHIAPSGPFARFGGEPQHRLDERVTDELVEAFALAGPGEVFDTRAALVWHHAMRLDAFCAKGELGAARAVFTRVVALAPADQMLREIGRRCGLDLPMEAEGGE